MGVFQRIFRVGKAEVHATIDKFEHAIQYRFKAQSGMTVGDTFIIYDVKPGDVVRIPMTATLERRDDGLWALSATCDVAVMMPNGRVELRGREGRWKSLDRTPAGYGVPVSAASDGKSLLRVR